MLCISLRRILGLRPAHLCIWRYKYKTSDLIQEEIKKITTNLPIVARCECPKSKDHRLNSTHGNKERNM